MPQQDSSMQQPSQQGNKEQPPRKENLLLNLGCNIIIPTLILIKLSSEEYLGVTLGLIVALAFPIIYGISEYIITRKINFFSVLGLISVLLTGGIGLLKLDAEYLAIKEASIPGLIGIATLISLKTRYPLVRTLIYNDKLINTQRVSERLAINNNTQLFEQTLIRASYILAGSFFLSSVLNYILARWIVTAESGTVEFNEQLGEMTALSFPVIMVPAMALSITALFYLFRNIKKLTQLEWEQIMIQPPSSK